MWRYIISIIFVATGWVCKLQAQDTIIFPLKYRVGFELIGASKYFYDKDRANLETYFSVDLDEKRSAILIAGRSNYTYSRQRDESFMMYNFNSKGFYLKTGIDFNMFKPQKAAGKYSLGVGFRYGITNYSYDFPEINFENYWGNYQTSIPKNRTWAHYLEATPAIRAEIVKNLSLEWSVGIRKMLSTGTGKDMKPIYLPGYGNGTKSLDFALSYFIIWNFSYKDKRVIILPPIEEEPED
jgi:hypothetical protein